MTKQNWIRGILLLALASVSGATWGVEKAAAVKAKHDILGITLGMTPAEVRTAFKTTGQPFQLREVRTTIEDLPGEPFLGSISARKQGGDSRQDTLLINFSAPPNETRVVMITRIIDYAVGKGPLKLDVAAALEAKYGTARLRTDHNLDIDLIWIDTTSGLRVLDKKTSCPMPHFSTDSQGHVFFAGLTIVQGCGLSLGAQVDASDFQRPAMASALWVSLVDYSDLAKQIDKTAAYVEQKMQGDAKARGTPQL